MNTFPTDPTVEPDQPFWNRPIRLDFKNFFTELAKAVLYASLSQWDKASMAAIAAAAMIETPRSVPQLAFVLLKRSMTRAIYDLLRDYLLVFPKEIKPRFC